MNTINVSTKSNSTNVLLYTVVIAVVLNLVLPALAKQVATKRQSAPSNGADKLSLVDQIMHMLVSHSATPLSSSILIAVIVTVSFWGGKYLNKS